MKGGRLTRRQGQIIPRGDQRWLVRIFLGLDPETRRRRYSSRTLLGSFRTAQHYLNARLAECDQGREPAGVDLTLNLYLDRWLDLAARPKLRAKSFRDYQAFLGRYIRPALGERELLSLTPLDIQGVVHEMHACGLSARTIQYTHAVLHAALEQAVCWRLIQRNPARGVALPKATRARDACPQPRPGQAVPRSRAPDEIRRSLCSRADHRHASERISSAALVGYPLAGRDRHGRANPCEGKWLELLSRPSGRPVVAR